MLPKVDPWFMSGSVSRALAQWPSLRGGFRGAAARLRSTASSGLDRRWRAGRPPTAARGLGFAALRRHTAARHGACLQHHPIMVDLAQITPMLLAERRPPVPAPGWLYELKHDGYRVSW